MDKNSFIGAQVEKVSARLRNSLCVAESALSQILANPFHPPRSRALPTEGSARVFGNNYGHFLPPSVRCQKWAICAPPFSSPPLLLSLTIERRQKKLSNGDVGGGAFCTGKIRRWFFSPAAAAVPPLGSYKHEKRPAWEIIFFPSCSKVTTPSCFILCTYDTTLLLLLLPLIWAWHIRAHNLFLLSITAWRDEKERSLVLILHTAQGVEGNSPNT